MNIHWKDDAGWGGRWQGARGFRAGARLGRGHRHGGFFGEAERGSVRYEILAILAERPRHGYDIIRTIEEKRGYRPSPGSIYPALQLLEEGDFIKGQEVDGKRVYTLTEQGTELLAKHRGERPGEEPGEEPGMATFVRGMRSFKGLRQVLRDIARRGDPELLASAVAIVERARRELSALLYEET